MIYRLASHPLGSGKVQTSFYNNQACTLYFGSTRIVLMPSCYLFLSLLLQPDSYVYTTGEELENIFNRLLKINLPNFEEMLLLQDSMEERDE